MPNLVAQFLKFTQKNELIAKNSLAVGLLFLASEFIWFGLPHLNIAGYAPLASPEKRFYIILICWLLWLLKFLLIDLETSALQLKDSKTRKKMIEMENRFKGAIDFLKKATSSSRYTIPLHQTPWVFLLGPDQAGKTTLLANSNAPFILQKQFSQDDIQNIQSSEHCDWWVTREACIIDVPSKYVSTNNKKEQHIYRALWQYFLKLVAKNRGKSGVNGVIIALPVMDILENQSKQQYQQMLKDIFHRIFTLQIGRVESLPCQIVFTKCDLIPGFKEFFGEASEEETEHALGMQFTRLKPNEKPIDQIYSRFNSLIRKINQQLLWRLHHERNPMARPYIKDFPLQLEQVKDLLIDFTKRFYSAKLNAHISSAYLTSAIQPKKEPENTTILEESIDQTSRNIQLFNVQLMLSRPFFIKELIQHGLQYTEHVPIHYKAKPWQTRFAYVSSFALIVTAGLFLGKDFQSGLQHTYLLQKDIADFQMRIAKMHDPIDHLIETINLLNTLKPESLDQSARFSLKSLSSFYTTKSEEKGKEVYLATLHTILLSEIKNFFEEYLKNPVNKDADDVYAVLKAYIMLGDQSYLNVNHIKQIISKILPKTLMEAEYKDLMNHLNIAFNTSWQPFQLSKETLTDARRFMASLSKLKMSYIILKNIDNNNQLQNIDLGDSLQTTPVFTSQQLAPYVPFMFTSKAFQNTLNQETQLSAQQAIAGNWILGHDKGFNHNAGIAKALTEQLRTKYVNNYVDVWEKLLANITLSNVNSLADVDTILLTFINQPSPLIQLLQTIHQNTFFEPIISASPKLQALGNLMSDSPKSQKQLSDIFETLKALHLYIQPTITANNSERAAYDLMVKRMYAHGAPDAIIQARLVANKSPEPLKTWLMNMADLVSKMLLTESGQYIDTSWQNNVMHFYQDEIANRYPFGPINSRDVDLSKFKKFFGNPGILIGYFNEYLKPLVDMNNNEWHWKTLDNQELPFSEDTLRQIQLAMRIHKTFFPNNDDKLHVQFTLQPYELGKLIKSVTLKINDKEYIDNQDSTNHSHLFSWPSHHPLKETSVKVTMDDNQSLHQRYPGSWGWLKLVSESFESMVSKKEIMLNLSRNEHPAKYVLFTDGKYNPFSSLDLKHFHLSQQLTEEKT